MNNTELVLQSLRSNSEGYDFGNDWMDVYLDNARPAGMNDKIFRAQLAQLSKQGLYKVVDGYAWGKVKKEGA